MGWILAGILEALNIADIALTEYSIKKGRGEEVNPFWKNDKKRIAMYPFKLAMPITLEVAGRAAEDYGHKFWRDFCTWSEVVLVGVMSAVVVNNIRVSVSKGD